MNVVIIKYNAGNTASVSFALQRLGLSPVISDDQAVIASADKVIFPGVGQASAAMDYLRERKLDQLIHSLRQPVLGICLGMQLMCRFSEEGSTRGLGIFDLDVKAFRGTLKCPQTGWNTIGGLKGPLFQNIAEQSYVYYVHGFYAETGSHTIAETDYNLVYSAGLQRDNFYALQFHPEKSGEVGAQILRNFLNI
jgi:glutamine amidotransferase